MANFALTATLIAGGLFTAILFIRVDAFDAVLVDLRESMR